MKNKTDYQEQFLEIANSKEYRNRRPLDIADFYEILDQLRPPITVISTYTAENMQFLIPLEITSHENRIEHFETELPTQLFMIGNRYKRPKGIPQGKFFVECGEVTAWNIKKARVEFEILKSGVLIRAFYESIRPTARIREPKGRRKKKKPVLMRMDWDNCALELLFEELSEVKNTSF